MQVSHIRNTRLVNTPIMRVKTDYKEDAEIARQMVQAIRKRYGTEDAGIFQSLGITEKQIRTNRFSDTQFKDLLHFFLKDKVSISR